MAECDAYDVLDHLIKPGRYSREFVGYPPTLLAGCAKRARSPPCSAAMLP